jgi:hypothetical protein
LLLLDGNPDCRSNHGLLHHSCRYLAEVFGGSPSILSRRCVCLCDDDNDIDMALACLHAYIPSVSSESMAKTLEENPSHFTITEQGDVRETLATEAALARVLDRIAISGKQKG